MTFLGRTAIVGVGYTAFTRKSNRSVLSLAVEACREAIADAGLLPNEVDGIGSFSLLGDSVPSQSVASALALPTQHYIVDLAMGGQAPSWLITQAAMAIECGAADAIVCFRAMNGRSATRVGSTPIGGPSAQYRYPIGFTSYAQYMAMLARRYMIETGATEMDLGAVAIAQRRSAQLNPRAILRDPLTPESYLAAEWIAEPYRVPDCTTEVDGACAVVVTSVDRAKSLKQRPAVIKGAAYGCGPRSGLDIGDSLLWSDYSRNFTSVIADSLWTTSGMTPGAVDFAQIYDCFTGTVLMGIEGLGFASRGKAGAFIRSDSLPINTNGGLLCEGYLHGMNTVAEAVLQLQGRASNQLDQARVGVVTSGGFMDGSALVLSAG